MLILINIITNAKLLNINSTLEHNQKKFATIIDCILKFLIENSNFFKFTLNDIEKTEKNCI